MTGVTILRMVAPGGDRLGLLEYNLTAKGEQMYGDKGIAGATETDGSASGP